MAALLCENQLACNNKRSTHLLSRDRCGRETRDKDGSYSLKKDKRTKANSHWVKNKASSIAGNARQSALGSRRTTAEIRKEAALDPKTPF